MAFRDIEAELYNEINKSVIKNSVIKKSVIKKYTIVAIVLIMLLNSILPSVNVSAAVNTGLFKRSEAALTYFQMQLSGNYVTFKKPDNKYMYIGNLVTGKLTKTKYPYDERTKLSGMHDNAIIVTNDKTIKYTAYGKEYENKLFGYISTDNKVLYQPQFIDLTTFKHGYAVASWPEDGSIYTALIDKKGNKKVIAETTDAKYVVYGKGNVSFPVSLKYDWPFDPESVYICYDMDGKFIDYIDGLEVMATQYPDYSHKNYTAFTKKYDSKYEQIEYAGYGKYVCKKGNNYYLISQDGKAIKTFKNADFVQATITSDNETVYLKVMLSSGIGAYSLTGKKLVPEKFAHLTYTDDNGFYGVTDDGPGKDQYLYSSTGKLIYHYNGSTPVTVMVDGLPTTYRNLDFWQPTHMYVYYNTPSKMKNISTLNLKKLRNKVKKIPNDIVSKKENELAKAVIAKASAPSIEVWTNELVMDWFLYYQQ